jgi:hypothetical protein
MFRRPTDHALATAECFCRTLVEKSCESLFTRATGDFAQQSSIALIKASLSGFYR